jgi:hypothetical protein
MSGATPSFVVGAPFGTPFVNQVAEVVPRVSVAHIGSTTPPPNGHGQLSWLVKELEEFRHATRGGRVGYLIHEDH